MPEALTNRELKDAIERTPAETDEWHALVSEACKRVDYGRPGAYPFAWLPRGVSWPASDSTGPSAW